MDKHKMCLKSNSNLSMFRYKSLSNSPRTQLVFAIASLCRFPTTQPVQITGILEHR
ncbi:hypothetical protein MtrunA17_Chr4g0075121 [Medicago truncatula]|uniref:Uncharacterized protein n=1 Tax=Medicago truncatula TaxID=3880 RepID=A0A396IJF1_MEDTR|nr:hypothetical protein MtrunA17_Chr4g0075121 [Medicago truncatula]